jgi:type IV pilus assembly protein PilM
MPLLSMARRSSNSRTLVGLEIDTAAVHAAVVETNGHIEIQHAASAALEPGVVRDGEVVDVDGLAEVLKTLWQDNKQLDKRVRIGLANQKIVVRIIELPPIPDAKELAAAVRFHAQDEVPMPLDNAVLDFHPLGIVETEAGPRQQVLIVAARRDMIDKVLAAARAAGLRPEGIDVSAFAMVRALHSGATPDAQVLYLSIGGLTNLAVAHGTTCLFTRVAGGGLEGLAVELAERRALTLEQAREWLRHVGLETALEEIDGDPEIVEEARHILSEGARRIAADVRNSLDFHHAQDDAITAVQSAVLTGSAAAVPGFAEALAADLGIAVEIRTLASASGHSEPERLTVAAGLAVEEAPR